MTKLLDRAFAEASRLFPIRARRRPTPRRFRPGVEGLGPRLLPSTIVADPPQIQTGVGFDGAQFLAPVAKDRGVPPDTSAAIGPKNVVEGVNSSILVFDRQGNLLVDDAARDFFATKLQTQSFLFDPRVVYDDVAKRFIIVFLDLNKQDGKESPQDPSRASGILVAVSPGDDATAPPSDWTMLRIDAGKQLWADFPMVGYNADGLFIDVNMFPYSPKNGDGNNEALRFHNARIYAVDMANLTLDGVHETDLPNGQFYTMYPAIMHGAQPGTPMEFVAASGLKSLTVGRLTNTFGGRPEDFQFTQLPLGPAASFATAVPPSQPHRRRFPIFWSRAGGGAFRPGGDSLLNSDVAAANASRPRRGRFPGIAVDSLLSSDVAAAAWRDNRLVVTRTVGHTQGGRTTNGVRWYEIDTTGSKPRLLYFGTIFPGVGIDVYHPSVDINAAGDLGLTFMQSSALSGASQFPSMYVADFPRSSFPAPPGPGQAPIRIHNDPATSIVLAQAGVAPLNSGGRAGDYSSTAVDPVDNMTFWAANEYATDQPQQNGIPFDNWGTFIQSFL